MDIVFCVLQKVPKRFKGVKYPKYNIKGSSLIWDTIKREREREWELERITEEKHPSRTSCVLSNAWIRELSLGLEFNSNILVRNYNLKNLKNYATSEVAVSPKQKPKKNKHVCSFTAWHE